MRMRMRMERERVTYRRWWCQNLRSHSHYVRSDDGDARVHCAAATTKNGHEVLHGSIDLMRVLNHLEMLRASSCSNSCLSAQCAQGAVLYRTADDYNVRWASAAAQAPTEATLCSLWKPPLSPTCFCSSTIRF